MEVGVGGGGGGGDSDHLYEGCDTRSRLRSRKPCLVQTKQHQRLGIAMMIQCRSDQQHQGLGSVHCNAVQIISKKSFMSKCV